MANPSCVLVLAGQPKLSTL
ncbi:hypothetical protein D046_1266A, partial [Vibrio parahaemolyticus V-223/04]